MCLRGLSALVAGAGEGGKWWERSGEVLERTQMNARAGARRVVVAGREMERRSKSCMRMLLDN